MNRRDFLRGATAAGLVPLMPGSAVSAVVSTASASAPAAVAGNFTPYMYSWAVHHARMAGQCSSDILASQLGVQAEVAKALTGRLIKKGIIGAPNALGVSRALNPFQFVESAPTTKTWRAVDPVHEEYVEQSRLKEMVEKLTSEEQSEADLSDAPEEALEAAEDDVEESCPAVEAEPTMLEDVSSNEEPSAS